MAKRKKRARRNPDLALKKLVEHDDCFCDVVNFFLDEDDKVIPEQLEKMENANLYRTGKGLKRTERDVVKVVKGIGEVRIIIGVENQCYEDEGLPLRLMCYDGLSYYRFYREMKEGKGNYRYPPAVLTIVFNFSRIPMNGKSIYGLMAPAMYPWVGKLGNDYRVHSIDVGFLSEEEQKRLGQGTIGQLVELLKMRGPVLSSDVTHMDDLADAFKELTGEDFLIRMENEPSGGDEMLMDFPIAVENVRRLKKEIADEGRKQGLKQGLKQGMEQGLERGLEQGLEQGLEGGRQEKTLEVIQNLLRVNQPMEVIATAVGMSIEDVRAIIESLQTALGK